MPHRLTRITAMAIVGLLVAGCSARTSNAVQANGNPASYGDCKVTGAAGGYTLDTITKGQLLMKTELPAPGWYNGDTADDVRSGFEFCLLVNIAHRAGIDDVKLVNSSFDRLVAGKAGDMDLSLGEITITDERRKVVDFSAPYFHSTAGVLVKSGADVTALNLSSKKLGVRQGTVAQNLVQDVWKPSTEPAVFPGDSELQGALSAGKVDAVIQDLSIVLPAAANSKGKLTVVGQINTNEAYGVVLPKNSPNTATVNKILSDLEADGTVEDLSTTYLKDAYGVDPKTVPVWNVQ